MAYTRSAFFNHKSAVQHLRIIIECQVNPNLVKQFFNDLHFTKNEKAADKLNFFKLIKEETPDSKQGTACKR